MKWIGMGIIAAYSVLMLVALRKGNADKRGAVCIGIGCILNFVSLVAFRPLTIAGMACISLGALINGIAAKKLHISHHILRLALEAVMVWLLLGA